MCFHAGNVMEDDFQDSQRSMHLIHDVHDYMHRLDMPRIRKPYYSRPALSMWYQFKQGFADWVENHKSDICEYSLAKLEFRHSDVLRMAHVIQKLLRALTAMSVATDKEEFLASDEIGPIALGAALRSWRRQVHSHFAYYKFLKADPLPQLNQDGAMEALMPGCSELPDGYKDRGLEMFWRCSIERHGPDSKTHSHSSQLPSIGYDGQ